MMRKLYLLTIMFAALLPSCATKKPDSLSQKTNITFWHAMGGPLGDALNTMVKEFEKTNPDVAIHLVSMANYSSLSQKLMGAVQVNAPPHLAQMYESWTTQFYALNKLVVIDSLIHSPDGFTAEEVADFYPAFIEDNTWDGKIVTLPFNKSLPVFFYNIDLLAKEGYHEFPKNWDGLRALLRAFTDRKVGRYGGAGIVNEGVFGALLLQQGGGYLDEENKKALFNSPAGVKAAQFLAALVNEDSTVYYGAGYEPQNDFLAGKIACIQSTSVSWTFLKPNFTFKVGIAPFPVTGTPAVIGYGTNIGIFRTGTAEQIRAAWRFVKWFTSPQQQAKWATLTFYVPVRKSALNLPEYQKLIEDTPGLQAALKQLDYLRFEPRNEAWFAGRRILGDALEKIIRAGVDPKKVLDDAAAEVEKELKK
ncbi:MAG: ABC transporter substrate-binding protein [bacterium]